MRSSRAAEFVWQDGDVGTPVVEDYADKMPYAFTGKLHRFMVVLEPEKLSGEEQSRLRDVLARAIVGSH